MPPMTERRGHWCGGTTGAMPTTSKCFRKSLFRSVFSISAGSALERVAALSVIRLYLQKRNKAMSAREWPGQALQSKLCGSGPAHHRAPPCHLVLQGGPIHELHGAICSCLRLRGLDRLALRFARSFVQRAAGPVEEIDGFSHFRDQVPVPQPDIGRLEGSATVCPRTACMPELHFPRLLANQDAEPATSLQNFVMRFAASAIRWLTNSRLNSRLSEACLAARGKPLVRRGAQLSSAGSCASR